jgi:hypothetical protein
VTFALPFFETSLLAFENTEERYLGAYLANDW